eukprot:COSAG04_NODE_32807_length_195_cov_26.354167_1_plen_40_part_01
MVPIKEDPSMFAFGVFAAVMACDWHWPDVDGSTDLVGSAE